MLALVLVSALAPAAAQASPRALINDCLKNGRIVGHYSASDYSRALANLPTDAAEYSDCAGVIRRAQLAAAAAGKRPVPAPAAGSPAANPRRDPLISALPAERAAVARARQGGSSPLELGGQLVRPGVVAARTSSILNTLPTPLLVTLGALALIGLLLGARRARDLVRARRSA